MKDKESNASPLIKENNKSGVSSIRNLTKRATDKNNSQSVTPEYQQEADYINRIEKLTSEQRSMVDNYIASR